MAVGAAGRLQAWLGAGMAVLALGATGQAGPAQAPAPGVVTFSEHVAPILFANCTSCHRPGEAAPFPLTSFGETRPMARRIATVTISAPEASIAARVCTKSLYLPVPTSKREAYARPAITSGSNSGVLSWFAT